MRFYFLCLMLNIVLIGNNQAHADVDIKKQLIIPINEWSSQRVLSHVFGNLVQSKGIAVSYQAINVDDQWGALQRGVVHVQLEVWQPSMAKVFEPLVNSNKILDMGAHHAEVREEWWYPEHVQQLCPDLPSWQALNQCASIFAKHNSNGKGVYFAGPWDYGDAELIRSLGLNFIIKRDPSDEFLWHRLEQALASEMPIVMLNWTPNWTDVRVKGHFIDFPHGQKKCTGDEIGAAQQACTKSRRGWLKKAAWPGLKSQWPCAYQILKHLQFTNEMIAEAAALIAVDGYTQEQAAIHWQEKYATEYQQWQSIKCSNVTVL